MSMDLSVWSDMPFVAPADLIGDEVEGWEEDGDQWAILASDWSIQVLIDNNTDDVVPDCVASLMPGAKHVAYVTLSPIGSSRPGYECLEKVVRHLARRRNGVWVDGLGTHANWADEGYF